jgi:hypothetical protein
MKERPILFSTEMVRAILEGRKTQTRRVIKPQPNDIRESPFVKSGIETTHGYEIKPKYEPGDRLWVRETWHQHSSDDDFCTGEIHYRATEICVGTKWIPSIFMPRWASRITLEVTNVRVERVRDISFEDCLSEGCSDKYEHYDANCKHEVNGECCQGWHYGQKWNFYYLWNSINAKRGYGWDVNPWVWVIEFKRVEDCSYDLR